MINVLRYFLNHIKNKQIDYKIKRLLFCIIRIATINKNYIRIEINIKKLIKKMKLFKH